MLDKTFNPQEAEARLYELWEESGAFRAGAGGRVEEGAQPYCIVIPPPNVTGSLHMGHALNNTLQDVLIRFERMRGKDVLWQPGLDHAGIATQMIVERQLEAEGNMGRRDMGREAFIDRVWKWKGESGGTIIGQLRRLGASCDWSRERFTLDDGLSKAVLKVFVELYREGLIYRDKRLVNWHPELQTAISDLEVENIEVKGHFWHFRYPLADGVTYDWPVYDDEGNQTGTEKRDYIVVATTRPETMLGDTGVAVNPEDERYKPLIGKFVELPLVGRRIPIVADEHADPEQGSGAVKITPAHDFNDFEVGKRQGLEQINILTPDGKINDEVPEAYRGLDRFKARAKVVEDIEALGLLDRIEDKLVMVPHDEKSKMVVIEPYLTDQWYVDAATLAKPAIDAVERGETVFVPKNWEKTYFEWMRNIQPWCISRQLWWGHRIPAWYGPDGEVFVAYSDEEAAELAQKHYGKAVELTRDEDVLDTWFSSGLWPFSTLGWPDKTPELQRYYKTDVLVTGFDIIFFWVARMMMMGLHFMNEVPFHTVYIHALVRDEKGQKMSKTKGNVIDPLQLIDEYGADALRFTLAAMAAQGRDIKLATSRVEGYRNFGTKLWNAARFCEMNECAVPAGFDPSNVTQTVNKWILAEAQSTVAAVNKGLDEYRFNEAAAAAYRFVWNIFCDWHLEFAKPLFGGEDAAAKAETQATTAYVLDIALKILHPFMPFVTEALWTETAKRDTQLIVADWPQLYGLANADAEAEMSWLIDVITNIRSLKAEMNIAPGKPLNAVLVGASQDILDRVERNRPLLARMARLEEISASNSVPPASAQTVVGETVIALPLDGVIDLDAERDRLAKELKKLDGEIMRLEKKLGNAKFVANAPEEVVAGEKAKLADYTAQKTKVSEALGRLETA